MLNLNMSPTRHYGNDLTTRQFLAEFKIASDLGKNQIVAFYSVPHVIFDEILRHLGLEPSIASEPTRLYDSTLRILEDTRRPNNNLPLKPSNRAITWMRAKSDLPIFETTYSYTRNRLTAVLPPTIYLMGAQTLTQLKQEFSGTI